MRGRNSLPDLKNRAWGRYRHRRRRRGCICVAAGAALFSSACAGNRVCRAGRGCRVAGCGQMLPGQTGRTRRRRRGGWRPRPLHRDILPRRCRRVIRRLRRFPHIAAIRDAAYGRLRRCRRCDRRVWRAPRRNRGNGRLRCASRALVRLGRVLRRNGCCCCLQARAAGRCRGRFCRARPESRRRRGLRRSGRAAVRGGRRGRGVAGIWHTAFRGCRRAAIWGDGGLGRWKKTWREGKNGVSGCLNG